MSGLTNYLDKYLKSYSNLKNGGKLPPKWPKKTKKPRDLRVKLEIF